MPGKRPLINHMKKTEGKKFWLSRVGYVIPWIGVVGLVVFIFWLNVPLVSLTTRSCEGTDCSLGILSVKNTQEDWNDGQFKQSSDTLHVKKQGLEFSFINPPAAQQLSLVLEWKGEGTDPLEVQLASNKEFTENVMTAAPVRTQLKDGWERVAVQIELPDVATRKWFIAVDGSQGHEVRLIQVNILSDPSLFAKLHSWWRNTHN